jgi:GNAT superfamily N-acetyltransferase
VVSDILRTSARVVGVYHEGAQIGYARVLSDRHTTAYLADVYVLPEHRGKGLGSALVGHAVDGDPQLRPLKWMLHTRDWHVLYRKFGFHEPDAKYLERGPLTAS